MEVLALFKSSFITITAAILLFLFSNTTFANKESAVNGGFDTVVYEVLKSFKQCDFSSFPLVLEADSRYSLTIDNKGEDTDQVGKMDSKNYGYLFSEFSKEMNDFCREKNIDLINTKLVRYELEKQEEELDFDKYILKLYLNDYIRDFILIFNAYSFGGDVLVSYKRYYHYNYHYITASKEFGGYASQEEQFVSNFVVNERVSESIEESINRFNLFYSEYSDYEDLGRSFNKHISESVEEYGVADPRHSTKPVISEEDLKEVESKLGIPFPEYLKDFYTNSSNGVSGVHYLMDFEILSAHDVEDVVTFLGDSSRWYYDKKFDFTVANFEGEPWEPEQQKVIDHIMKNYFVFAVEWHDRQYPKVFIFSRDGYAFVVDWNTYVVGVFFENIVKATNPAKKFKDGSQIVSIYIDSLIYDDYHLDSEGDKLRAKIYNLGSYD